MARLDLSHPKLPRWILIAVAAIILSAQHTYTPGRVSFARVCSGDEPHYLLLLNGFVADLNLDLSDEYQAVHAGGLQAGDTHAGSPVAHHTVMLIDGKARLWQQLYNETRPLEGAVGEAVHQRFEGVAPAPPGLAEYPVRQPGAVMLAPLLWPFAATRSIEPLALLLSAIATILGMIAFIQLSRSVGLPALHASLGAFALFVATPVFHYSRTFFMEPFLLAFAVGAYALYARGRPGLAILLLALGTQMKPPFLILALPFLVDSLVRRQWRDLSVLIAGCVAATGVVLATNAALYGSPFTSPQPFVAGNILVGASRLLFDWRRGVFILSPILLLSLLGWWRLLRQRSRTAILSLAGASAYFGVMSLWEAWHGGWCYGPRLIVPVLPLFGLGFVAALPWLRTPPRIALALPLLLVSLALNGYAAYRYCKVQDRNPVEQWAPGHVGKLW